MDELQDLPWEDGDDGIWRPWFSPPDNFVPGVVDHAATIAHTAQLALVVRNVFAYPNGFEFSIWLHLPRDREVGNPDPYELWAPWPTEGVPDEHARLDISIQFADGTRASFDERNALTHSQIEEPPPGTVIQCFGETTSSSGIWADYWIWPLPPPGPMTLNARWPVFEIDVQHTMDAGEIQEAAHRAHPVFRSS